MALTIEQKMLARLAEHGVQIPEGSHLVRTYAGTNELAAGRWAWSAQGPHVEDLRIGSPRPGVITSDSAATPA